MDVGITLYGQVKEREQSYCHGKDKEEIDQDTLFEDVTKKRFHGLRLQPDFESLTRFDLCRSDPGGVLWPMVKEHHPDLLAIFPCKPQCLIAL
jgi:hypothetical protein